MARMARRGLAEEFAADVDSDDRSCRPHGLSDPSRDRARAASDVEHVHPGHEQLCQPAVVARERARIKKALASLWHCGPMHCHMTLHYDEMDLHI